MKLTSNGIKKTQYVVIGLGQTGQSCLAYLTQHNLSFFVIDTRNHPPQLERIKTQYPHVLIYTGPQAFYHLQAAHIAIMSPGLSWTTPLMQYLKQSNMPYITDIDLFAQQTNTSIIGITGSNGKSTVTTWVTWMAQALNISVNAGGNLGIPVLDLLNQKQSGWSILELSSFQLEQSKTIPLQAATLLNITPDHLDYHGSFQSYYEAKHRIFEQCQTAIFHEQDELTYPDPALSCHKATFSSLPPEKETQFGLKYIDTCYWLMQGSNALFSIHDMKLSGWHNLLNAATVLTIGLQMNLSVSDMLPAVKSFAGLPHRCQWIANKSQVDWFNDSKGTNEAASIQAIKNLATHNKPIILIAGGKNKGSDFKAFAQIIHQSVKAVILFGEDADAIKMALNPNKISIKKVSSLEKAVQHAAKQVKPHEQVLLSPACTSLDMFDNYQDRGHQFIAYVQRLPN